MGTGLTERGLYENRMGWNDTCIGTGIVGVRQQGWLATETPKRHSWSGAMKYGISKSSLEDNKIGTGDITMVSFQIEHQQRKLLQLHRSAEAHHQL